jgi:hypothetical protein
MKAKTKKNNTDPEEPGLKKSQAKTPGFNCRFTFAALRDNFLSKMQKP